MSKKIKIKQKLVGKYDKPYTENIYPAEEDIYSKAKEEKFRDFDDQRNENSQKEEAGPANDLDIPGTELDDALEKIGEEDEENNYYSLGGDDHDNLDEDQS